MHLIASLSRILVLVCLFLLDVRVSAFSTTPASLINLLHFGNNVGQQQRQEQKLLLQMANLATTTTDEPRTTSKLQKDTTLPASNNITLPATTENALQKIVTPPQVMPSIMDVMADFALGSDGNVKYKRGLLPIGFIMLLFSSNSPVLHAAFSGANPPPMVDKIQSVLCLVLHQQNFCHHQSPCH
jgi:hypothetical protein